MNSILQNKIFVCFCFFLPFCLKAAQEENLRKIILTAVSKDSAWTLSKVDTTNYWRNNYNPQHGHFESRQYEPANIIARKGEKLSILLQSFDNLHGFYIPDLKIGPFEINKGDKKEIRIDTAGLNPGAYLYICTKVQCSDRHHFMRGYLIIYPETGKFDISPTIIDWGGLNALPNLTQVNNLPQGPSLKRGEQLFRTKGCVSCHNIQGQGGIKNINYVFNTIPKLNNRAELLSIFEIAEGLKVIEKLSKGEDLSMEFLLELDLVRPAMTLAQYESMKNLIRTGKPHEGKIDPSGIDPPLFMPTWVNELSNNDINNILAYLLTLSEYDDGEINNLKEPPLKEILLPDNYNDAMKKFMPESHETELATGDKILLLIFFTDILILTIFLFFHIKKRRVTNG